jgi:hypothetical protein
MKKYVELFRGTLDGASVHPREVVIEAIHRNAAALILCHNHPLCLVTGCHPVIRAALPAVFGLPQKPFIG